MKNLDKNDYTYVLYYNDETEFTFNNPVDLAHKVHELTNKYIFSPREVPFTKNRKEALDAFGKWGEWCEWPKHFNHNAQMYISRHIKQ